MAQSAFYQNIKECTGCGCCQVACKDKNDLPIGFFFRKTYDYEGGQCPDVWAATLSMSCNHCDNPACVAVCPAGALFKEAEFGFVVQKHDECIGCQSCVEACPYGAPKYDEAEGKVRKCDGCIDWVKNGMEPACSGACSTRALKWGEAAEFAAIEGVVRDLSVLPSSEQTSPNFFMTPREQML